MELPENVSPRLSTVFGCSPSGGDRCLTGRSPAEQLYNQDVYFLIPPGTFPGASPEIFGFRRLRARSRMVAGVSHRLLGPSAARSHCATSIDCTRAVWRASGPSSSSVSDSSPAARPAPALRGREAFRAHKICPAGLRPQRARSVAHS